MGDALNDVTARLRALEIVGCQGQEAPAGEILDNAAVNAVLENW
jgi:hypothetical protein